MPLSPHVLETPKQIEEDLRAGDPDLITALSVTTAEPERDGQDRQRIWGTAEPPLHTGSALRVALALVLIVAAVMPPTWIVVLPLLLALVLLPWLPGIARRVGEWLRHRSD